MDWVVRYPQLIGYFSAHGMNPTENRSLMFESLSASCRVQQLSPETVLNELQALLQKTS